MSQDAQLLSEYSNTDSPSAFAALVRRYINLVYSAARRQVRDEHLAQDVTQAVFMLLSRKGGMIRNPVALPAWLLKTTHHVCCNALRERRRRARYEKEAASMIPLVALPQHESTSLSISAFLDEALAHLRERDRSAIVLRFLEDHSIMDVAHAMGTSEAAAQKRILRALSRLRDLFARRGIHAPADALPATLSNQLLLSAPPGLLLTITAKRAAGGAAAVLARAALRHTLWNQIRAAALGCAGAIALAGGAAIVASGAPPQSAATPPLALAPQTGASPATQPATSTPPAPASSKDPTQEFPNAVLFNTTRGGNYAVGIDPDVLRTEKSDPAGYIESHVPQTGINAQGGQRAFGAAVAPFRGKRIRLTAWVKTKNVDNWSGLEMCVYGFDQRVLTQNDMGNRPIFGTTDWKQYSLVTDVPPDAQSLIFLAEQRGRGETWIDDFKIEVVGNDVPVDDDQLFHMWSPTASKCSAELDPATLRDGHPTMRVINTAKSWVAYDHNDRHPDQYVGKRVRASAWLKADHVSVNSGLWIRMIGPNFQKISEEGNWGKWETAKPIKGTVGWTHFTCEADVPIGTQCIVSGMIHNGTGTMWMDDFQFETVETPGADAK